MVDIPGEFMQVDMDEIVHMRLEGTMADLVVKLPPETYEKFVVKAKERNVLYVQLKKALYGTLCAALLFWRKLTEVLQSWGSKLNPYDQCVANKTIASALSYGTLMTLKYHIVVLMWLA
jgi:hypothetical protein